MLPLAIIWRFKQLAFEELQNKTKTFKCRFFVTVAVPSFFFSNKNKMQCSIGLKTK